MVVINDLKTVSKKVKEKDSEELFIKIKIMALTPYLREILNHDKKSFKRLIDSNIVKLRLGRLTKFSINQITVLYRLKDLK